MRLCETFVNRSCCKTETLLRRTYTFDLVYFLYASLLCISKEKTVWGTLLQTNTFLQSSDKKSTSPTLTQIKILGIYEKQKIKLDIFVNFVEKKKNNFLDFKLTMIFFYFIFQVWRTAIFWVKFFIFYSKLLSGTKQQLFCPTESDTGQGPSKYILPLALWAFAFSSMTCITLWWNVKALQKNALKM